LRPVSVFCSLDFSWTACFFFFFLFLPSMDRPLSLNVFEAPRFQAGRHIKLVRLSATITRQEIHVLLVVFFVRGRVYPRAILRPEGLCQRKIPITQLGIEPTNYQFVA
jgi:hypothetical protein